MATIEERANKYAKEESGDNYVAAILRYGGYVKGAQEQEEIDINKAVEWLKNNLTNENDPQRTIWMAFVNEFKKAMEK